MTGSLDMVRHNLTTLHGATIQWISQPDLLLSGRIPIAPCNNLYSHIHDGF